MRLSWDMTPPPPRRVVLTADSEEFDPVTVKNWKDEGYEVVYLPFPANRAEYVEQLKHLSDPLELGEKYAIVAYGDAASVVLDVCVKPMFKLATLVAYYPTAVSHKPSDYPSSLEVVVHLASSQKFSTTLHSYEYPDTQPGFAETNLETYRKISSGLAWSRTLGAVRKGLKVEVDLEKIWDEHLALEFAHKNADETMKTMIAEPYVNHIPTMTGGIGAKDLHRFYRDFFIPHNPASLKITLVSRTVGTDRIVDEMVLSFTHDSVIHWMLPGVQPTGKDVEMVLVSVVCIRGGKLYHEHIHWDQASVLVQIGLLDPQLVPQGEKGRGTIAKRLPVVGREGARKVLDEREGESNELIEGWKEEGTGLAS